MQFHYNVCQVKLVALDEMISQKSLWSHSLKLEYICCVQGSYLDFSQCYCIVLGIWAVYKDHTYRLNVIGYSPIIISSNDAVSP